MGKAFDQIIQEFIDFVNMQVGMYMDAIAGFQGHQTRIKRQIHRTSRAKQIKFDEAGNKTVVFASYEDPTQPDIIHSRIIRAPDYIEANSEHGINYQQHSRAILIFVFTFWEDEMRPKLAKASSKEIDEIKLDIMGDLRILRNVILHSKGVLKKDKHRRLKELGSMFPPDKTLIITYENMHKIFVLIKQDLARLMFQWLGFENPKFSPDSMKDIAINFERNYKNDTK